MEVIVAIVLTTLFAVALAVIFGFTALRNARAHPADRPGGAPLTRTP